MMKDRFFGILAVFVFAGSVWAQVVPKPVIETEVRDNDSIRMRSLQIERIKREYRKPNGGVDDQFVNFSEIARDFEDIQRLQSKIVKTYTTGQKINIDRIGRLASEISKKAARLDSMLFFRQPDDGVRPRSPADSTPRIVRDLIIELDAAIGDFVLSPIFKNDKLVDQKLSEKLQIDLRRVIELSRALSIEAKRR